MKVSFDYLDEFERGARALRKKYPSFDNLQQTSKDDILITLMAIYDKSEIDNVSDAYLRSLVQEIEGM